MPENAPPKIPTSFDTAPGLMQDSPSIWLLGLSIILEGTKPFDSLIIRYGCSQRALRRATPDSALINHDRSCSVGVSVSGDIRIMVSIGSDIIVRGRGRKLAGGNVPTGRDHVHLTFGQLTRDSHACQHHCCDQHRKKSFRHSSPPFSDFRQVRA
ncbi:MAG: hypothetical protein WA970_15070, partial [Gammaproteobacteria bacterium]